MTANEILDSVMARHDRVALMFSGGKDSLAVLELARPHWDRLAVIWVDTGAQLPEVHAMMDKFKTELPAFFIINSDQPRNIREHGLPTDILPVWNTTRGMSIGGPRDLHLQDWTNCCEANIWRPSIDFIKALGCTAIVRGQRNDERFTAPTRNGDVLEGIEVCYPIQSWTHDEVLDYLAGCGYSEERFQLSHSSLDCWSCTAFAAETPDRLAYLKKHHPEKAKKVFASLNEIRVVVQNEVDALAKSLEVANGV